MERIKVLTWEKVSLVVPEKQDINTWMHWLNDIETQAFMWPIFWNLITHENEEKYYENLNKDDKQLTFSILVLWQNKVIWNISLMNIDYQNRRCDLGVAILDINSREKWYWTDSIKLILKYAFEVLWLNKVKLKYIDINYRAKATYEKFWFKEVWRLKQENFRYGEYYDDIIMELMRDDYLKIN